MRSPSSDCTCQYGNDPPAFTPRWYVSVRTCPRHWRLYDPELAPPGVKANPSVIGLPGGLPVPLRYDVTEADLAREDFEQPRYDNAREPYGPQ